MAKKKSEKKTKARRKRSVSRADADVLLAAISRAEQMFDRIVKNGYSVKKAGEDPKPLSQPDRRDIAEFLLFEVAAKFEQFSKRALVLEVQKTLKVNRSRAEHMVGSAEDGIPVTMGGWAHVTRMRKRATGILGKTSVYARIEEHLSSQESQRLRMAVLVRNRIAHGKGNAQFVKMLKNSPVKLSARQRQGISPGKLLVEYPSSAASDDKWFFRLLGSYRAWATIVKSKI